LRRSNLFWKGWVADERRTHNRAARVDSLLMTAEASLIDLSHRGELALITRIAEKMTTDLDLAYSMMATRNGSRL
jgi:hypothetical protein